MKRIAIIPARGGSKRIPRKNIRKFLGKPIIAYSIEKALQSNLFDNIIVSTDDEEIAEIARSFGAEVPFLRSSENSDDHATTADVLLEVISKMESQGAFFDIACCIYPTAPLLKVNTLIRCYDLLIGENFETVFPVVEYSYPIFRSLKRDSTGSTTMYSPEFAQTRTQDLPEAYHDAGQFYWFNVDRFKNKPALFGGNSGSVVLSSLEVQDIDTEDDWKVAEAKAELVWKGNP